MKFQGATSTAPSPRLMLWLGVGVTVLVAGEAALQGTWVWLAMVAMVAAGLALVAKAQQGTGERGLAAGLALLAVASGIAAARMGHAVFHAGVLQSEAVRDATRERDKLLQSSIASANRTGARIPPQHDRHRERNRSDRRRYRHRGRRAASHSTGDAQHAGGAGQYAICPNAGNPRDSQRQTGAGRSPTGFAAGASGRRPVARGERRRMAGRALDLAGRHSARTPH